MSAVPSPGLTEARVRERVRTVDLGLPPEATHFYGTSLVGAPARRAVLRTFGIRPSTVRLACFHLDDGTLEVVRGVRGELSNGFYDATTDRVHALTDLRLHEVALGPLRVLRETTKKIAPSALLALPVPGTRWLVVRWNTRSTAQLIDATTYEIGPRVSIDQVDASFVCRGKPTIFSFWRRVGRHVSEGGTLGKPFEVPMLLSPIASDAAAYAIDDEGIVRLDRDSLTTTASRTLDEVQHLLGFDAAGRLVATTEESVVLLDPDDLEVDATISAGRAIHVPTLAGPCTVVAATAERSSRDLVIVEWDGDATR